jgi:hypothetical protein
MHISDPCSVRCIRDPTLNANMNGIDNRNNKVSSSGHLMSHTQVCTKVPLDREVFEILSVFNH